MAWRTRLCILALFVVACGALCWFLPRKPQLSAPLPPNLQDLDPHLRYRIQRSAERLNEDTGNVECWGELGMVYEANGLLQEAISCYGQADALQGGKTQEWRFRWAMVLAKRGELQAAVDIASAAEEFLPALWRRGNWLLELGNAKQAATSFRQALAANPGQRAARLGLARALLQQDLATEAIAELDAYREDHPQDRYAQYLLGIAQRRLGNLEQAGTLLRQGSSTPPHWTDNSTSRVARYHAGLAQLLADGEQMVDEGQYRLALKILKPLRRRAPDNGRVLNAIGLANLGIGETQTAIETLHEACQKAPDDYRSFENLATAYGRAGKLLLAGMTVDKALKLNPKSAHAWSLKGTVHWNRGQLAEAIAALRQAHRYEPTNSQYLYKVGEIQLQAKQWAEAEKTLGQLLARFPHFGAAHSARAIAQIELKQLDAARRSIEHARRFVDGNDRRYQEALQRLEK